MPHHLTLEERDLLAHYCMEGLSQNEIAAKMQRHKSTISRELSRNQTAGQYFAGQAHCAAQRRRRERPLHRKIDTPQLNHYVRHGLSQCWSPEQIAARFTLEQAAANAEQPAMKISAPTIYKWIAQADHSKHWRSFCDAVANENAAEIGLISPIMPKLLIALKSLNNDFALVILKVIQYSAHLAPAVL